MKLSWACEIDPFCRKVYRKHWPETEPFYDDIRTVVDPAYVDVLCGGFPCQDLSQAGRQAGIDGERSGLWSEFARLIGEVRPRYAIVENVPGLLSGDRGRWFGRVLGDLAEIGYDAEWHCISAAVVGAPHIRDRVWVVAYASASGFQDGSGTPMGQPKEEPEPQRQRGEEGGISTLADATIIGSSEQGLFRQSDDQTPYGGGEEVEPLHERFGDIWTTEPDVGRVAHGVPNRVDRLKSLGNAVVPQVVEWIGLQIIAHQQQVEPTPTRHKAGVQ